MRKTHILFDLSSITRDKVKQCTPHGYFSCVPHLHNASPASDNASLCCRLSKIRLFATFHHILVTVTRVQQHTKYPRLFFYFWQNFRCCFSHWHPQSTGTSRLLLRPAGAASFPAVTRLLTDVTQQQSTAKKRTTFHHIPAHIMRFLRPKNEEEN